MIIKVILVFAVLLVLVRLLSNSNSYQIKAWTKIIGVLFTLLAVFVILFPNSSNDVAGWVGVTRGADLLLYMLAVAFIFLVLNLYLKSKQDQGRIVKLARKLAILEAETKYKNR